MLNRLTDLPVGRFSIADQRLPLRHVEPGRKRAADGIGNCSEQFEFRHRHCAVVPQTFKAGTQKATFYQGTGTFECGE